MSLERYRTCLGFLNLPANELEWFPRWMKAHAEFPSVVSARGMSSEHCVTRELVIEFLQSLRDRKIEAWRRLQAARAIEIYQGTVLQTSEVDFRPIRQTLQRLARIESNASSGMGDHDPNLVPGEGNDGLIDQDEPEFRNAHAGGWCRHSHSTRITRAQGRQNHDDLHARDESSGIGGDQSVGRAGFGLTAAICHCVGC